MGAKNKSLHKLTASLASNLPNVSCKIDQFPFKTVLTLEPLIDVWKGATLETDKMKSKFAAPVIEKLKNIPELTGPIEDLSVIEKNIDIVDVLMSIIYPAAQWNRLIHASIMPFKIKTFYCTDLYEKIFGKDEKLFETIKGDPRKMVFVKTKNAYLHILNKVYGKKLKVGEPAIVGIDDQTTGLRRYFQLIYDPSFVNIKVNGEAPKLSEEDIDFLLKDVNNLENWMKYLPPEKFEFHGFVNISATNVTDQEVLSQLKHDLLEKESIISLERFKTLQGKLQDLFRLPNLRIGLAAIPKDWNQLVQYGRKIGESFMFNLMNDLSCSDFENSIYDHSMSKGKKILIEDLEESDYKGPVEKTLIKHGIKNIAVSPLYYDDELIGILELGTDNPGDLNSLNGSKLAGVIPLFSMAVKRSMEELENNLQAVIKEECTAIHPSVEWRFRQAAFNLILKREEEKNAEMESIVFENVYPLYGLSDIRNSSTIRNEAIQSDLIEHLQMAKDIVQSSLNIQSLPYLDALNFRIEKHIKGIKSGLSSGDELSIIEFLQNEVESAFTHFSELNTSIKELVGNYKKTLDPNLNSFYRKRKDFEESVAIVNESIANYLEEAEIKSQEMFPHYFEKYKTDGVEHGIYIGQSLVESKKFDLIYLKNLRLWQLMVMCGIVKKTNEIKPFLKIPLDTAHLILIQNSPLSIRFRLDEKKFDVDGTYNIRYEIMKKRIDKAVINGTKERLTQPNKIAMVYSHPREASEYKKYIEFLKSKGYLEGNLEELDLESLQGVQGLRALRVTVNTKSDVSTNTIEKEEVIKTVTKIEKQAIN